MAEAMTLRIHQVGRRIRVLGPGTRYAVWVQGCPRHCPGCVAPDAQPLDGGRTMTIQALAEDILRQKDLDGLTISGGEPFLQARALAALIDLVREKRDLGVIVYTGYLLEELRSGATGGAQELLRRTDLLIDGPYIEALNDDAALRGSSNQRVIALTERYQEAASAYGQGRRQTELLLTDAGFFMAGVPSIATMGIIKPRKTDISPKDRR